MKKVYQEEVPLYILVTCYIIIASIYCFAFYILFLLGQVSLVYPITLIAIYIAYKFNKNQDMITDAYNKNL